MCGISGFLGQYPREIAQAMRDKIAHRGPDAHGLFYDENARVALGHRRLSIIDLTDTGSQPMDDRSGRYVICYNGEVYNFQELRLELEQAGHSFRGRSDTEVVIECFAKYGVESFGRLNGIFALAIWDRQDARLTLARDGLGVKPLYVTRTQSGFCFASEIKAFLALPDLDRTLDPVAISAYLTYLWSPGERTPFQAVKKLTPGCWLTVDAKGREDCGQFYDLPQPSANVALSDEMLISTTRQTLERAVQRQLMTDVEIGAFLSGGLDSSAIVALARDQVGSKAMQCFTIDYAQKAGEAPELVNDLPYAERAADYLDVELHKVKVDSSIAYQFEQLVYVLDEPQADPAALNNMLISALARQNGIKVLLSGTGGDDLFTGYRRHLAARFDPVFAAMPSSLRKSAGYIARTLLPARGATRRIRKLMEAGQGSDNERAIAYFEWTDAQRAGALMNAAIRPSPMETRAPMIAALDKLVRPSGIDRVLALDQHYFLADHNLNYTDKTGMAHGVEIRVPFLDLEMADWASRVPNSAKIRHGVTKWVLRKAMESHLPNDIIYRPKAGFGVPLRSWLRHELRPMLDDLLHPNTITKRGLFDQAAVQKLLADTMSGHQDGSYTLLALMTIELWCRKFVDERICTSLR